MEFMKKVIGTAKEIAGEEKIPLYLSEAEIRRLDREEAVQEGYDAGKADGIEQTHVEMIIALYKNNVSLEIISKSSGLSIEEIENIINNHVTSVNKDSSEVRE